MAVRKNLTHPESVRQRIRVGMLVRRLTQFVLGEKGDHGEEIKMSSAQVTAALGLLKKAVPDLSAVEHSGELRTIVAQELSDAELANIAAGGSAGVAETPPGPQEPGAVH